MLAVAEEGSSLLAGIRLVGGRRRSIGLRTLLRGVLVGTARCGPVSGEISCCLMYGWANLLLKFCRFVRRVLFA